MSWTVRSVMTRDVDSVLPDTPLQGEGPRGVGQVRYDNARTMRMLRRLGFEQVGWELGVVTFIWRLPGTEQGGDRRWLLHLAEASTVPRSIAHGDPTLVWPSRDGLDIGIAADPARPVRRLAGDLLAGGQDSRGLNRLELLTYG